MIKGLNYLGHLNFESFSKKYFIIYDRKTDLIRLWFMVLGKRPGRPRKGLTWILKLTHSSSGLWGEQFIKGLMTLTLFVRKLY